MTFEDVNRGRGLFLSDFVLFCFVFSWFYLFKVRWNGFFEIMRVRERGKEGEGERERFCDRKKSPYEKEGEKDVRLPAPGKVEP